MVDPHEMIKEPGNRTDDFFEAYNEKVEEIKELGKKHRVKAILQTGDFLDVPKVNTDKLFEIMERWSVNSAFSLLHSFREGGENALIEKLKMNIPLVGIVGNHELYGEALSSYPRTSLSVLEKNGFMNIVSKDNPMVFEEDGISVAITGTSYHSKIDEPAYIHDYLIDSKKSDYHIHMVHGMLTNKSLGTLIKHTTVDQIKDRTIADLTISGHDHIGFPLLEHNGKQFVNPGSMTRVKADKKEINRKPKVLLIEITKDNGVKVKTIYLKSALKGEDVLSRELIEKSRSHSAKMEEIRSTVNKAQLKQGTSMKTIVSSVSDSKGIEDSIKEDLIDRVSKKMDEFSQFQGDFSKETENYTVKRMELVNFQSHERSEFDFSDGLNIFVGESGNGKSAVLRAFDFVLNNKKKNPRDYIQVGADKTEVTLFLSNGLQITREVERKKTGINGYTIYNEKTGETEKTNTKYGDTVLPELLGLSKVIYDVKQAKSGMVKSELDINFIRQASSWFFIGDGLSGGDRAKLIGSIFGTHYSDAVIRDLEKELKDNKKTEKIREVDLSSVEESLKEFSHLDDLEARLEKAEEINAQIEQKKDKLARLIRLKEEQEQKELNLSNVNNWLMKVPNLSKLNQKISDLRISIHKKNSLILIDNRIKNGIAQWTKNEKSLASLSGIPEASQKLRRLLSLSEKEKGLREELNKVNEKLRLASELENRLKAADSYIERFVHLKKAGESLAVLKVKQERLEKLKFFKVEAISKYKDFKIVSLEASQKNEEKINFSNQYVSTIKASASCPTCYHELDETAVKRISRELLK